MARKGTTQVNVYMTDWRKKLVKKEAEKLGVSQSHFINYCVDKYFHENQALLKVGESNDV